MSVTSSLVQNNLFTAFPGRRAITTLIVVGSLTDPLSGNRPTVRNLVNPVDAVEKNKTPVNTGDFSSNKFALLLSPVC